MSTDRHSEAQQVIDALTKQLREINERIARYDRALIGTPYVVELCPHFFMVVEDDGFAGGSIVDRVMMYSPERIDAVIEHIKTRHGAVFGACRAMHIKDALISERNEVQGLLSLFEMQEEA